VDWLTRGSTISLWIPSVLLFSVLDHLMLCNMLGEDLNECALGELKRSPPHLFMYLILFSKTNKGWKQKFYWFEYRGIQIFINSRHMKCLKHLSFFLFFIFLYSIYDGK
jgi:hypothetical protein